MIHRTLPHLLATLLASASLVSAATPVKPAPKKAAKPTAKAAAKAPEIAPTHANVPYGTDPAQVMDVYLAKSDRPTPVVFYIHGGGWRAGDKAPVAGLKTYLDAGISVVSIQYRFVTQAQAAGIEPPVKWPLEDAARALQFVRSKAQEWHLNPNRIGATGGSAGGASTLWLCCHDDLADPTSADPIARQSTRLTCGAPVAAQTCFDPHLMREWLPGITYGGHAFGFTKDGQSRPDEFQAFYEGRDRVMPWIQEYSPYHLVTPDDPPLYLSYSPKPGDKIEKGAASQDPTHSPLLGLLLAEKLKAQGVEHYLTYPGAAPTRYASTTAFLIEKLTAP